MLKIALLGLSFLTLAGCDLTTSDRGPPATSIVTAPAVQVQYRYRSKATGRFVTRAYALSHPNTTVRERVKR